MNYPSEKKRRGGNLMLKIKVVRMWYDRLIVGPLLNPTLKALLFRINIFSQKNVDNSWTEEGTGFNSIRANWRFSRSSRME